MAESSLIETETKEEERREGEYDEDRVSDEAVLSSGNGEIDRKMGGGIPLGSLVLVEGDNDTGKSVLLQQFMWGGLQQGYSVAYYTTENTVKSLLRQMDSLSLSVTDYFLFGHLKIFPFGVDENEPEKMEYVLDTLVDSIRVKKENIYLIDSLTVFITKVPKDTLLSFFSACKDICDTGKTIILTAHRYAFEESTLVRIRSVCDGHIELSIREMGDKLMKTMKVSKMRGANRTTGNMVSFEVLPEYGLRIIPISSAKV